MRLKFSSVIHCTLALTCMATSLHLLARVLSLESGFPEDILSAFSEIDFTGFNNDTGSHQTLIPAIVHIFHQDQNSDLTFLEAAAARAAVKFGNADTVYIHSLGDPVTGRYLTELMFDPLMNGDKLVLSPVTSFAPESDGASVSHQWRNVFPFLALGETGGVLLTPGTLLLADLHPYLKYEAAMYWQEGDTQQVKVLLAHKSARVNEVMMESTDYVSADETHPVLKWVEEKPEIMHRFAASVCDLSCDLLLQSQQGSDLVTLLNYDFLILNTSQSLDSENIKTMPGNTPAILRMAWYDTTKFVYD